MNSLVGSLMETIKREESRDQLPPLPTNIPPRPPSTAQHRSYLEASDVFKSQLLSLSATLERTLTEEQAEYLKVIIRLAEDQQACRIMGDLTRPRQTNQHEVAEHKLAHVRTRIRERFNLQLSVEELKTLNKDWQRLPSQKIHESGVCREIHYKGNTIYAVYEVTPTGAQYLTTVLVNHPLADQT